jgi:ribokinase
MIPDIVVVGSHAPALFMDVQRPPQAGETVTGTNFRELVDGGKGSNQAIAASRLGARVSFVGMVGKDHLGEELKDWFESDSVDYSWLAQNEDFPTGAGFNFQTQDGDCALVTCMGANEYLTKEYVEKSLQALKGAKILLTQFEIPPEIALFAADLAIRLGMRSIVNPAPAASIKFIKNQKISILIPNEIEAKTMLALDLDKKIETSFLCDQLKKKSGAECVIITLGSRGFIGLDDDGFWEYSPPVVNSVDASGAGDEFCAALGVALVEGNDIRQASIWAAHAAALSVTKQGTIPAFPFRSDLEQFILTI